MCVFFFLLLEAAHFLIQSLICTVKVHINKQGQNKSLILEPFVVLFLLVTQKDVL